MDNTPPIAADDLSGLTDSALAEVLDALVGPGATPRLDQDAPLRALLAGQRVLCVQATGWGKSTVYFSAARALRQAGLGPTLVVSPLLALMRDQVAAATRAGLSAVTVNSANVDDWDEVFAGLRDGTVDICFVSPERLAAPSFAAQVPGLLASVALVVVDEAHCISDWGHDFRPDYRRLAGVLTTSQARVLATTATANARVCDDIAAQLGDGAVVFRGSLARSSLRLNVVDGLDALERYAWVADALDDMPGAGIVYCLTVAETERLAGFLTECGHVVRAYSSQLTAEERVDAEDALRNGSIKALVATSALGMGYDHPALAFVCHVGSPASPVAYYQQVGRAGRAIDDAIVVLLPAESDDRIWDFFATASVPDPDTAAAVLAHLDTLAPGESTSVVALEAVTGARRGRLEALCKVLAVDGAVERIGSGWVSTGTGWSFDALHYEALVALRRREAETMRVYARGGGCLMAFLQDVLDDPYVRVDAVGGETGELVACGRCSVCTDTVPVPGPRPSPERVVAARDWLRGRDTVIEPRKRWPGGIDRKGTIVGAGQGRALAFADDPAWAPALATLAGDRSDITDALDGPVSTELLDGLVGVLSRWAKEWGTRPVCVVAIPSRRHPERVASIAEHIARVGRLPLVKVLEVTGAPAPSDVTSGVRAQALFDTLLLTGAALPDGPVLLIDDTYQSGWTMTVAAALLREAGASAVYPLVLQQLP